MGCNFQEYNEWKVKGEQGGGALECDGRMQGWEDAPLQPCSLSVAVLGHNFVLTMLWLVIAPRGIKGKQGGRLPGWPAPMLRGPRAGHDAKIWCLSIPQLVGSSQHHHPCFQKPPSTTPRAGQQLWNITVPRRKGEALNINMVLCIFRLQNWIFVNLIEYFYIFNTKFQEEIFQHGPGKRDGLRQAAFTPSSSQSRKVTTGSRQVLSLLQEHSGWSWEVQALSRAARQGHHPGTGNFKSCCGQ